jgi:hypothetical protein
MRPETVTTIAAALLAGKLDEPSQTDLGAAVRSIADLLAAQPTAHLVSQPINKSRSSSPTPP